MDKAAENKDGTKSQKSLKASVKSDKQAVADKKDDKKVKELKDKVSEMQK